MVTSTRLHLLVEGQTEETIVNTTLAPYLATLGWYVGCSIIKTRRLGSEPARRGGATCWAHIARDLRLLLRDSSIAVVTTLLDYYAFPSDAPGMADRPGGDAIAKVEHVERAMAAAIGDPRFLPNLVLHETEAWVLAAHDQLGSLYGEASLARKLKREVDTAGGPELVNDGPSTAPSKRLLRHRPDYVKTLHGPLAIDDLGLPGLRAQCPHLDQWLARLETGS
ncbi:MAG TPA: DUF4276 family protein [Pseudonocardiaceae bacterium]|nr:DUF4276 family protein [Pseudonocardiaceae bacterium]